MSKKIILGTRGSNLALWQTKYVKSLLENQFPEWKIEIKIIHTKGDLIQDRPLPSIGGKGLFTVEIENELRDETIDIAVHSLKDLPTTLPEGLILAGSPKRGSVADAFVSTKWKSLEEIPDNALIATGSLRRKALVQRIKPNVKFCDLRGNIETRLRKLDEQGFDGIIMAHAALERLEKENYAQKLDPKTFTPAVGQGAIGIEIKASRKDILEVIEQINDSKTVHEVTAERSFMKYLEGGCSVPLGAWAHVEGELLILNGFVGEANGKRVISESIRGYKKQAIELGEQLAVKFINLGAKELLSTS